ncbi:MAG: hypothetical protein DRR00_33100 [Candidatus Parabeggiatoa sp. nov. 3]|nr:MAG: hypothetical protein DRR00_33100 [Gammaproteobacteria bacterium]RKZ65955.1 MAG: hypothetical protein DRQ99_11130 [Gammaproteobacteria bacterium]
MAESYVLRASQLTGILDKKALLIAGLKALITLENRQWLHSEEVAETENPLETFQAIMEIAERCAALPILEARPEDDILGYS